MRVLIIDDLPNTKHLPLIRTEDKDVTMAMNFDDGIKLIADNPRFDVLYLDNDLGDPDPVKDGYRVLCWIELDPDKMPNTIIPTTRNPSALLKMKGFLNKYYQEYPVNCGVWERK